MILIRQITSAAVLLAATAVLNGAVAQEVESAVLASFSNGETITEQDLTQYVGRRVDLKAAARNVSGVITVVQEMALARALTLEGESAGVSRRSEGGDDRFDDVYALTIFKTLSPLCEAPKDKAATREFYDKNPKAFTVPTTVRLARIILPVAARIDGEHAGTWLMNQVQAIGAGSQTFADAASKADKIYKLEVQGDLGWVMLNDENLILRALADANQSDIVGPVKDGEFVYLFQIVAKKSSQIAPWKDVSAIASQRAVSYCREQGRADVQHRMFQKYGVQVDEKAVRGIFNIK
ncbi:MAG: peptidyl-prolyl cis-trans isomerase [Giesbergeria sp.]